MPLLNLGTNPNDNTGTPLRSAGVIFNNTGLRKNNYAAIVGPLVTNDSTQGYEIGSLWLDTVLKRYYVAASVLAGNAEWKEIALVPDLTTSGISNWATGIAYKVGTVVITPSGMLYRCKVAHTSTGAFGNANAGLALWDFVEMLEPKFYNTSYDYPAGSTVIIRDIDGGLTAGTISFIVMRANANITPAGAWSPSVANQMSLVSQSSISQWTSAGTYTYSIGQMVTHQGAIYAALTNHTSLVTTAPDLSLNVNWRLITAQTQAQLIHEIVAIASSGQTAFTLGTTPKDILSVVININGVNYYQPDFTISGVAVTWAGPITLETTDKLVFTYN